MQVISNVFEMLDNYVGSKSFDSLSLEQIRELLKEFATTRQNRILFELSQDEKLLKIEKELMTLSARLINNNQTVIYR